MEDVKDFFREMDSHFTIYVVEQRFVVGRGADYFRSFKGKINYIDSDSIIKKQLLKILKVINKRIPNIAEIVKQCFEFNTPMALIDIVSALSKIFNVTEHQAAGPDVIDPIIIQEGNITPKYINQMISLHKNSILRPVIIVLLKDNDFERAKKILSGCPHNTNLKFIRNSGQTEHCQVINCGATDPSSFLDAFSHQCFSTCSHTKRNVLMNEEWAENSIIKLYAPSILQIRSNLLFGDKTLVRKPLNDLIDEISLKSIQNTNDASIARSFVCILKLFRLFCNDGGIKDIEDALNIAKSLNSDILLAHVYRNAYFFNNISFNEKLDLMDKAYKIFSDNNIEDHAIYCLNNKLVRQFDTDNVSVTDFLALQEEATYNVPGLVGMPHILMNSGAALLTNGHPDEAIRHFEKGLSYAYRPEYSIQKAALLSNKLIAQAYLYNDIPENELRKILNLIFDNKNVLHLPFLAARYALNVIAVAFNKNKDLAKSLLEEYPVDNLIQSSLDDNILGSGQLLLQINQINDKYGHVEKLNNLHIPSKILPAKGIRKDFIIRTTYNPCSFSTWF